MKITSSRDGSTLASSSGRVQGEEALLDELGRAADVIALKLTVAPKASVAEGGGGGEDRGHRGRSRRAALRGRRRLPGPPGAEQRGHRPPGGAGGDRGAFTTAQTALKWQAPAADGLFGASVIAAGAAIVLAVTSSSSPAALAVAVVPGPGPASWWWEGRSDAKAVDADDGGDARERGLHLPDERRAEARVLGARRRRGWRPGRRGRAGAPAERKAAAPVERRAAAPAARRATARRTGRRHRRRAGRRRNGRAGRRRTRRRGGRGAGGAGGPTLRGGSYAGVLTVSGGGNATLRGAVFVLPSPGTTDGGAKLTVQHTVNP